jgi:hypothetical protein
MKQLFKVYALLGIILILIMALSACLPSASTPPPPSELQGGGGQESSGGDMEPEAGTGGEAETGGEVDEAPQELDVAEDIPIPEGSYDAKVSSDGRQVVYKVAGTSEDVVIYYQEKLAGLGWESAGPGDTAVGNTGLMLRTNAAGDRLSINIQYNPNGEFSVVTLAVTRTGNNGG